LSRACGGGHEILEPLELNIEGAVREGDGDPLLGERCRVEGGGSCDREVDAVREVGTLVEVRVEEREAKVFGCMQMDHFLCIVRTKTARTMPTVTRNCFKNRSLSTKEIDHEVSVGATAGRPVDVHAIGQPADVLQQPGGLFSDEVARVRNRVPEVVDGRDAVHRRRCRGRVEVGGAREEEQRHDERASVEIHGGQRGTPISFHFSVTDRADFIVAVDHNSRRTMNLQCNGGRSRHLNTSNIWESLRFAIRCTHVNYVMAIWGGYAGLDLASDHDSAAACSCSDRR
jgi:hypothetical protein